MLIIQTDNIFYCKFITIQYRNKNIKKKITSIFSIDDCCVSIEIELFTSSDNHHKTNQLIIYYRYY